MSIDPEGRESPADQSAAEALDSAVSDRRGAPSWPVADVGNRPEVPPPVGLNWGAVAGALGIDITVLRHEGAIVLAGDHFPEAGYYLDPADMRAHYVDVGDVALRPGYFLADLSIGEFAVALPIDAAGPASGIPVVRPLRGAITGLFTNRRSAEWARRKIVQAGLGAGMTIDEGPLGVELRVRHSVAPGLVATVIASQSGAVVAVGGTPLGEAVPVTGPATTAFRAADGALDVRRAGKGASTST